MSRRRSSYVGGFAVIALIAVMLPLAGRAAPTAANRPNFDATGVGFTMALLNNNNVVAGMGASWVEYTLSWHDSNLAPGSYNWGNADNIMDYAGSLHVIIRVMDTPDWARPGGTPNSYPPTNPQNFTTFMAALTSHLSGRGTPPTAFEIWNEPNLDYNWGGQCPDPTGYMRLVQAAANGVRSVNPSIKVVAGAVTTTADYIPPQSSSADHTPISPIHAPLKIMGDRISACHTDDILFIRGMYQNSAGIPPTVFDVLSSHPYGFAYAPETDPRDPRYKLVYRRAELQHNEMVADGDGGKQIWFTEMGWPIDPQYMPNQTDCPRPDWYFIQSQQQQADYMVRALEYARGNWPWAGVSISFNFDFVLAPWFTDHCNAFSFFSVYGYWHNNPTPRPAYYAIQSWITSPPPTATVVPTATPTNTPVPVDHPPTIASVNLNQSQFNRSGGTLIVQTNLIDGDISPIASAFLFVTDPSSNTISVPMTLTSGSNTNGVWQASYAIAPNIGSTSELYSMQVIANDTASNSSASMLYPVYSRPYRFWDVPDSYWAASYINSLAAQGVIGGYGDGSFRPANGSKRDELSRMLTKAYGWPLINPPTPSFPDVPTGYWAYQYIETVHAHGAVGGFPDGLFHPGSYVNRGQLCIMITRASGWPLLDPPTPSFTDVARGSWSYQNVETAVAHSIVGGYSDGTFRPANGVTRAELTRFLYRVIQQPTTTPTTTITPTATSAVTLTPPPATGTVTDTPPPATASPTPTLTLTPATTDTPANSTPTPPTGTPTPTTLADASGR